MTKFTLEITVPNDKAQDILETITNSLGYGSNNGLLVDPDAPLDPNLPTRVEFLRQHMRDHLKHLYKNAKTHKAQIQSQLTVDAVDFD